MPEPTPVIMCKFPVPGRVKTRLCPPLSHAQAADVQAAFLKHLATRLPAAVFCVDDPAAFVERFGDVRTIQQGTGNLGDRLIDVRRHLPDTDLLFLGADVPDLPAGPLLDVMQEPFDVAIAPTDDGGYWCVRVNADVPIESLFGDVDWSSGREYEQTLANAARIGATTFIGESWRDCDEIADLRALLGRLSDSVDPNDVVLREGLAFLGDPATMGDA
ncbi:MAG: DUF2064 domain-containing protein [Planctomycetota bacterium]